MQSILAITAPIAGTLSVNGRLAGETSPELPLLCPIQPYGAVYLDYRPLCKGYEAQTRKLVFSKGRPLADSLEDDLFAVVWPGGVTELEFSCIKTIEYRIENHSVGELSCQILRGENATLEIGGLSCAFPADGQPPELYQFENCIALMGSAGEDQYMLTFTPDMARHTGTLRARRIEFERTDIVRATTPRNDVAGHATSERWLFGESGLQLLSTESTWEDGMPRIPETPEATARAAIEAALLEAFDEAESYLHPSLRQHLQLTHIQSICDMCVPAKYAPPSGTPCIGLLSLETSNCARIQPMYYEAVQSDGRWLLTRLAFEEP